MTNNMIYTVKVKNVVEECQGIKTISFNLKEIGFNDYIFPKPGQFVMVWVPGVDEVPMSISDYNEIGDWSITVKNVGECTNALNSLKIGNLIGIRGPLGNNFKKPEDKSKKIILIAGGFGTSPLKFFAKELDHERTPFDLIEATKFTSDKIFINDFNQFTSDTSQVTFCREFPAVSSEISTVVSQKFPEKQGRADEYFQSLLKDYISKGFSKFIVYTCGPEKMMYNVFQICEKYSIEIQASLERIMRCGCGLCGLCALDPLGLLVCKDGPVFSSEQLRKMSDFGKYKRDFTGKKIKIE